MFLLLLLGSLVATFQRCSLNLKKGNLEESDEKTGHVPT